MKSKVICGREPILGAGKTRRKSNSWDRGRSAIVSPGRRTNLILAALQLVARKIRSKE